MAASGAQSHERIRASILQEIESGQYPPGTKIPSIRAISRSSGVSTLTVARAIKQLTAEGVLRPEHGRGCFVERVRPARVPSAGTVIFALSIPPDQALTQPLFARTLVPAQQILLAAGLDVLLQRRGSPGNGEGGADIAAGDAVVSLGIYDQAALADLAREARRMVVIDVDATGLGLDSVFLDDFAATGKLVRALAERGARRIAFVGGPLPSRDENIRAIYDPAAVNRLDAWRGSLTALGLPSDDGLVSPTGWRDRESTMAATRACLERDDAIDAVIAEDAVAALEATEGLGQGGGPLVAGWGMEDRGDDPRLVACALPSFERMGEEAARLVTEERERTDEVRRIAIECPVFVTSEGA